MTTTANIKVSVENIFPLIKKFLYSDHEIFLRELISNATDATLKLKHLIDIGEAKCEYGHPIIEVKINKKQKTLHVIDQGIGMTAEEIDRYINQIAFSGAEEFVQKYKDKLHDPGIIGHFGLGFYSAFMVADKVEIISKSYKDEPAAHWMCDGSPNVVIKPHDRKDRGTEIILHIANDSKEFLEEDRIRELLLKYNKFMPIPIKFGTKTITQTVGEGKNKKEEKIEVDNIINNTQPLWKKNPNVITNEEYKNFYHELFPMQFDEPLFNIHLNIDYPFHLTGILYFPKLGLNTHIQKNKIHLYQNHVFVTDNVEGILPEFLAMLRGVIDSPDIPLNVSRSFLQADAAVKKISGYITRKVADKLQSLYKDSLEEYQSKWNDIKVVIEYGMLTDDKFFEKAPKFALYPTTTGEYYLLNDYIEKIKPLQTNKDGKVVILYTSDTKQQHIPIEEAQKRGYSVLLLDSPLIPHLIQKLEINNPDIHFARVDADPIEKLIQKEEKTSILTNKEIETLKSICDKHIPKENYVINYEPLDTEDDPLILSQSEFMRRMKDMNQLGGSMFSGSSFPDMFTLTVNTNHPIYGKLIQSSEEDQSNTIQNLLFLAKLSKNLLHGEELRTFVKNAYKKLI